MTPVSYLLSVVVFCISKEASFQIILIHLRIVPHKMDIFKQWTSDATGRGFCSGSTLFTLNTRILMKHGINRKKNKKQRLTSLLLEMDLSKDLM